MSKKNILQALVLSLCSIAATCGTAENGKAASPADAQIQPTPAANEVATPPADDTPSPMPPPFGVIPRPPKPGTPPPADAPSGGPCAVDGDCVRAACCHPKTCVDKAQAPSCAGVMCTMDCRAGTMDCGGGKCVCTEGTCAAKLEKPGFVKGVEEAIKAQ